MLACAATQQLAAATGQSGALFWQTVHCDWLCTGRCQVQLSRTREHGRTLGHARIPGYQILARFWPPALGVPGRQARFACWQ